MLRRKFIFITVLVLIVHVLIACENKENLIKNEQDNSAVVSVENHESVGESDSMNNQSEANRIEASNVIIGYSKATIDSDKVILDSDTILEVPRMVIAENDGYAEVWEMYVIDNKGVFIKSEESIIDLKEFYFRDVFDEYFSQSKTEFSIETSDFLLFQYSYYSRTDLVIVDKSTLRMNILTQSDYLYNDIHDLLYVANEVPSSMVNNYKDYEISIYSMNNDFTELYQSIINAKDYSGCMLSETGFYLDYTPRYNNEFLGMNIDIGEVTHYFKYNDTAIIDELEHTRDNVNLDVEIDDIFVWPSPKVEKNSERVININDVVTSKYINSVSVIDNKVVYWFELITEDGKKYFANRVLEDYEVLCADKLVLNYESSEELLHNVENIYGEMIQREWLAVYQAPDMEAHWKLINKVDSKYDMFYSNYRNLSVSPSGSFLFTYNHVDPLNLDESKSEQKLILLGLNEAGIHELQSFTVGGGVSYLEWVKDSMVIVHWTNNGEEFQSTVYFEDSKWLIVNSPSVNDVYTYQVKVITDTLNVRLDSTLNSEIVGKVNESDAFDLIDISVYDKDSEYLWFKIGENQWIASRYCEWIIYE